MEATQKLGYDDFILLNDHLSFHPGGLIATFNLLSNFSNKERDQTILDFGCGNGISIGFLKKLGYKNLIGYDRNPTAIELCRKKFAEFKFFNDVKQISESVTEIDLLLLESIFSFNDQLEVTELIKSLQNLIQKFKIKEIGIVDFYSTEILPSQLSEKMKTTFGMREVRDKKKIEEIILSLSPNIKTSFFHEHSLFMNLSDKYQPNEQAKKLMKNELLSNTFTTESEAQDYFSKFLKDMLNTYSSLPSSLKYFECVAKL